MKSRERWIFASGAAAGVLAISMVAWTASRTPEPAQVAARFATSAPIAAPNALTELSSAIASVARVVRPAVVYIESRSRVTASQSTPQLPEPFRDFDFFFGEPGRVPQQQAPRVRRGAGTGFIISSDGNIITNSHVVGGADRVDVELLDQRRYSATVVGRDPATDIAVIKIAADNLPTISLGNSDSTQVGDMVLAIGNPMGQQLSFTVTAGIISAKGRPLGGLPNSSEYSIQDFLQTDAAINPGNSGGPLVNSIGQAIGVNSAIASQSGTFEGYGFAVPMNLARRVAEELLTHGRVTRAILGVSVRQPDQDDAAYVGLDTIQGVVVQDFTSDDSPAKRAGVQPGDVIVRIDDQPVRYVAQLQQVVAFHKPGDVVRLTVQRKNGERRTFDVKLVQAPEREAATPERAGANAPTATPAATKLGIAVQAVGAEATVGNRSLGSENRGLMVMTVDPEGPSSDKLAPRGSPSGPDIITHVDSKRVTTVPELQDALSAVRQGAVVSLRTYNPALNANRVVRIRAN